MPSMVGTTSGRTRRDEVANRLSTYYWMFGIDLSHAAEIAPANIRIKNRPIRIATSFQPLKLLPRP